MPRMLGSQRVLVPGHSFILDDTRVRQPPDEIELSYKSRNDLLLEPFKPDPFHSYHLSCVQVKRAIRNAKLSSYNTIPKLLRKVR